MSICLSTKARCREFYARNDRLNVEGRGRMENWPSINDWVIAVKRSFWKHADTLMDYTILFLGNGTTGRE
jgi:hypothetical protein